MVTTLFKILQPELDLVRQRLQEETSIQGRTVPGLIWPVLNHLPEFGVKIFHSLFCKGLKAVDNFCSP